MENRIYRGHIPFVRILLFFVLGILCAYWFEPNLKWYRIGILCLSAIFLIFILVHFTIKEGYVLFYLGILFFLGMFCMGWIMQWKRHPIIQASHFSHFETDALIGIVNEEPKFTGQYLRFQLKIKKGVNKGEQNLMEGMLLVNLKVDSARDQLHYGDQLVIRANYREVSPPYNPGEFNYRAFLANSNIWHTAFVEKTQLKKIGEKKGSSLIYNAIILRQRMIEKFEKYLQDKSALSIASALVLGYRQGMEKEVASVFTDTGTVHVLAVSGLHVGIVFVVFSALLFWMNANPRLKFAKGIILILLIWFYALITGFSPSVLRAAIMISFTLIALNFVKDGNIYNTIAASALMLLLFDPKFIMNVGFQLSYLAVIAIIYLYPMLKGVFSIKNRLLGGLWNYSALSMSAQLITFPLVMYYFNTFPLYFLPANLFIILPATLIVYLGFALLIVPNVFLSSLIGQVLERLILFSKNTLEHFAQLPFVAINGISLSPSQVLLIYAFLLSSVFAFTLRKKQMFYSSLVVLIALATLRLQESIYIKDKVEFRLHNVNRGLAIGIVKKEEYILYADSSFATTRGYSYLLETIELEKGKDKIKEIVFPSSYRSTNVLIEKNIVQVKDKRMVIYDEIPAMQSFLVADLLLIRNNVKTDLPTILENISFKKLIVDGSNSDQNIEHYAKEAEKLSLPFYVLKDNFAYVW
jgi:competence protein ComEC